MFTQYSHDQSGDLTYEDFLLMLSQCSIESALFTGLLGFAEGALALTPTLILTPTLTLTLTLALTLTLTLAGGHRGGAAQQDGHLVRRGQ